MRVRHSYALPAIAFLLIVSLAPPAVAAIINGTNGPDVLIGTPYADTIRGYAGNETLRGRRGPDYIYGSWGADQVYGGYDMRPDVLYGGPGPDRIYGGTGDTVYAGYGNDVIVGSWEPGFIEMMRVRCGPGYDRVVGLHAWVLDFIGPNNGGCEVYPH